VLGRVAALLGGAGALLAGCLGSQTLLTPVTATQSASVRTDLVIRSNGMHPDAPSGLSPASLQSAYNLPSTTRGSGQVVAVVDAFDNPNVGADLAQYRSNFGLPPAKFFKYNQDGQQGHYPAGSAGWGVEIDLDVEMVSASCPNCTIYLIEANTLSIADLEAAEDETVKLGAHIVSNSWECAGPSACVDQSHFDTKGVEYLAAASDAGSGVSLPAAFDSVVATGGTVLTKGGGGKRGWTETIFGPSGACTTQPKPAWQHLRNCKFRLANDVAAVADNVAEYDTYDEAGWLTVGGTSVSTPFLAGVFGLAGNATKQDGGRTFWQNAHHKHLYPVPESASGQCAFVKGQYNTCAGWGSPNGIGAF
jgi:subtilase family serine protease